MPSRSKPVPPLPRARAAWPRARLALVFLALLGTGLACSDPAPEAPAPARGRVLLIGIDGASPLVTRPWMKQGLLPNLDALSRAGAFGPLQSHFPLLSPRIWTSIATGKTPEQHGITSWVRVEGDTPTLLTGRDRKVHALWNIASRSGLEVGVVNWLNTQPPEEVNGVMVTDFAIPGERKGREAFGGGFAKKGAAGAPSASSKEAGQIVTHPSEWADRVDRLMEGAPLTSIANPFEDAADLPHKVFHEMLARTFRNDDLVARIALEIDETLEPDLMMVFFPGIDRTCHMFWGGLEPEEKYPEKLRFTPEGKRAAAQVVRDYYHYADALIGKLLERYGPNDLVLIVSDHGFEAVQNRGGLTGGHDSPAASRGVVFARGPGVTPGTEARDIGVNDITPTILAWLGLPVGADMAGRPAPFVAATELASVPTWDTEPITRIGIAAEGTESDIIEDLRALGYVE